MKRLYSVLVENRSGVLMKVAGLFSRRMFNIDSLAVGETDDPNVSCITIVSSGEKGTLEQIEKQLNKKIDVIKIKTFSEEESVSRELILVKIRCKAEQRQSVISISEIFRAKIVDVTPDSLTAELTGDQDKLEAFLKLLEDYKILEIARTGITGLSRGR